MTPEQQDTLSAMLDALNADLLLALDSAERQGRLLDAMAERFAPAQPRETGQ